MPGEYPARLQVIGPDLARVLDRTLDGHHPRAWQRHQNRRWLS